MKELILVKYGELILKGLNRYYFESVLLKNIRYRLKPLGRFEYTYAQSTLYITPPEETEAASPLEESLIEKATGRLVKIFGIASVTTAAQAPKEMGAIATLCNEYLSEKLLATRTFKVEAKRSDKHFPLKSPQICDEIGGSILAAFPHLKVDVHTPELVVRVEIRDTEAYVHAGGTPGAGGLPTGTSGKATLLLSGGIDSPVAGFMMGKRGLSLNAVYFSTPPYTSEQATDKVVRLAKRLTTRCGRMDLYVVPFTDIAQKLRDTCPQELYTLLMRRYMMRISEKIALRSGSEALITGESLAQVASQTTSAIAVTNQSVALPVFRPLIGMDKEEIVRIARKIDTFDISVEPYEDCCVLFSPKHPKTKPNLEEVLAAEGNLDACPLIEAAADGVQIYQIRNGEDIDL